MDLQEYLEEEKKLREFLQANAETLIKPLFEDVLDSTTGVKAICWVQYTPYFNDGDPCVFGVHDPHYLTVNDFDEQGNLLEDSEEWRTENVRYSVDLRNKEPLSEFERKFFTLSNIFEAAFGDYSRVEVSLDENNQVCFQIEEYEPSY